jgi:hypothetical protein
VCSTDDERYADGIYLEEVEDAPAEMCLRAASISSRVWGSVVLESEGEGKQLEGRMMHRVPASGEGQARL